jgi:hypothetical protein
MAKAIPRVMLESSDFQFNVAAQRGSLGPDIRAMTRAVRSLCYSRCPGRRISMYHAVGEKETAVGA